jgi:hypothetical protein
MKSLSPDPSEVGDLYSELTGKAITARIKPSGDMAIFPLFGAIPLKNKAKDSSMNFLKCILLDTILKAFCDEEQSSTVNHTGFDSCFQSSGYHTESL